MSDAPKSKRTLRVAVTIAVLMSTCCLAPVPYLGLVVGLTMVGIALSAVIRHDVHDFLRQLTGMHEKWAAVIFIGVVGGFTILASFAPPLEQEPIEIGDNSLDSVDSDGTANKESEDEVTSVEPDHSELMSKQGSVTEGDFQSDDGTQQPEAPDIPEHRVKKTKITKHLSKIIIDVELDERLDSETQLDDLSRAIREEVGRGYRRVFIHYKLRSQGYVPVNYAYAEFLPELSSTLSGATEPGYQKSVEVALARYREIDALGLWEDPAPSVGPILIYRKGGGLYIEPYGVQGDGSGKGEPWSLGADRLKKIRDGDRTKYVVVGSDSQETFYIDSKGRLEIYERGDFIGFASPIDVP